MTPFEFYRSKTWEKFRAVLIQERTNADGLVICEKCGKPILRKYDCIAHHKKRLTDDNVNDVTIALNPDNVELIHFKCHNEEHQRYAGFAQRVYLVYGSPCSGKTSWVNEQAYGDDLILDVDRLWDAICNDGRYGKQDGKSGKPNRLKANVFGIRDAMLEQIRIRKGKWRNAYIIGGYPLRSDRDRLCELLNATPIYIEATRDECLKRADTERPERWKDYINNWFDSYTE